MDNNQDLTVTLRAKVDDAITALKKVRGEFDNTSKSMTGVKASSDSMTTSIIKGAAAYDLLRTAVRAAGGFLKDSLDESINAARIMQQVETNVKNAGLSYADLAPKIKAYGEAAVKLGFDDETAAQSLSRLLLVTKDYNQARELTNLSMDLARNKNINLEDATRAITLVTQGNTRALKEYGIDLGDTATTAQVLIEAHKKLKDSSVDFSNTAAGKLETVRQQWDNIKQSIGDKLMPVLIDMINKFEQNLPQIEAAAINVANAIGAIANATVKAVNGANSLLKDFRAGFDTLAANNVQAYVDMSEKMGNVDKEQLDQKRRLAQGFRDDAYEQSDAYQKQQEETQKLTDDVNKLTDAYNAVHKTKVTADQVGSVQAIHLEAYKDFIDQSKTAKVVTDDFAKSMVGLKNNTSSAGTSTDDLKNKYKDLKDALVKVRQTAVDELNDLRKAHEDNIDASTKKISDLNKSLDDLTYSYQRAGAAASKAFEDQKKSDRMGIAATIVAQQEKINGLRNQYDTEQDPNKKIGIKEALDKEVAAYASTAQLRIDLSNEISATEARNSMTDLERAVADYTAKRVQADAEYADNRADAEREYNAKQAEIKLELAQTKDKLKKDNDEYMAKRDTINKYLAQADAERLAVTVNTSKAIMAQIDKEIDKYNALANAIQRASQGKSTPINMAGAASHEHGGIVQGPAGMPVPIIAHAGEMITPASNTKGGSAGLSIVVNLNYPQLTSSDSQEVVKKQIEDALRDVIRNNKLNSV